MSADVITALREDSIKDILSVMRRKGLRRMPVVTPRAS
jgi:predicted transcriptional regulator